MVQQAIKMQGKLPSMDENNKAEVKKAAAFCSVSQFPGGNSSLSHCRYRDSFIWEMVTLLCYDNILTFTV